ncbi:Clp protease adaptor protein ClpS [Capsulimonas corticalis]|uniref:Clp protease adaptor protein ClpS n=1 Tax=Capsulimonas corticalis TaxID=2219043 RepID=A0A402CQE4_9BACT|nr:ATP-dependent Clp protease adaptor ClpS [Capsulimonas corticalis]BDI32721.1 Clp protease adaptor protein ClpS [Capsulimonas corticalis]
MSQRIDLMPATAPAEEITESPNEQTQHSPPETDKPYVVIVYDDDWHSFGDVEVQLQKATACTLEKAEALAREIDSTGRAIVFAGSDVECERVANVLREIRLQVETDRA